MLGKCLAVFCFLALPFSVSLWYHSHRASNFHRYDLTLYKSIWVYLKDGVCGLEILCMPTRTPSRSEFHTPLGFDPLSRWGSYELQSYDQGPYRTYWIVFPFWLPTFGLILGCLLPLVRGPGLRAYRRHRGRCEVCGYSMIGNKTGRCPECGNKLPARIRH